MIRIDLEKLRERLAEEIATNNQRVTREWKTNPKFLSGLKAKNSGMIICGSKIRYSPPTIFRPAIRAEGDETK